VALASGRAERACAALARIAERAGLAEVLGLADRIRALVRITAARIAEEEGRLEEAVTLYRAAALESGDAEADRRARELYDRLRERRFRDEFVEEVHRHAKEAFHRGDLGAAAALYAVLAELAPSKGTRSYARRMKTWHLLGRARDFLAKGRPEAARALAEEARDLGESEAADFLARLDESPVRTARELVVKGMFDEAATRVPEEAWLDLLERTAAELIHDDPVTAGEIYRRAIEDGLRPERAAEWIADFLDSVGSEEVWVALREEAHRRN
jgi:hypothetical protein